MTVIDARARLARRAPGGIDQIGQQACPTPYQVLATLACPPWCVLAADHEQDGEAGRVHRAAVFDLDGGAYVSVAEAERVGHALGEAFRQRDEIDQTETEPVVAR